MPIVFSDHALAQLKRRRIDTQFVKEVILNPEKKKKSFRNRSLRRKVINGKILEVVTITEGSRITVVTGYYLEK